MKDNYTILQQNRNWWWFSPHLLSHFFLLRMPWFSFIYLPLFWEAQKLKKKLTSGLRQSHYPSHRNRLRNPGLNHWGLSNYFAYDMWSNLGPWDIRKDCWGVLREKPFLFEIFFGVQTWDLKLLYSHLVTNLWM